MAQWQKASWAIARLIPSRPGGLGRSRDGGIRHPLTALTRVAVAVIGLSAGCRPVPPEPTATVPTPPPVMAASPTPSPAATPAVNLYQRGLDRGASAANLTQIAQSRDDWRLVATRWQQAIDQFRAIPASSPDHSKAQQKIREYQRNLTIAQAQATRPNTPVTSINLEEALRTPGNSPPASRAAAPAPAPAAPASISTAAPVQGSTAFRVPIVQRMGGTPVIHVTFNGGQSYPMILDTGASGTVITPTMAQQLGVRQVGQAQVNTASAANVTFPLGYVQSMQVGDAIAENVVVAIAGPELTYGLLGQNFFQAFDITIREHEVEFQPR